jgi:hypothetical protein
MDAPLAVVSVDVDVVVEGALTRPDLVKRS